LLDHRQLVAALPAGPRDCKELSRRLVGHASGLLAARVQFFLGLRRLFLRFVKNKTLRPLVCGQSLAPVCRVPLFAPKVRSLLQRTAKDHWLALCILSSGGRIFLPARLAAAGKRPVQVGLAGLGPLLRAGSERASGGELAGGCELFG